MNINLFLSYYVDKNDERRQEILTCLEKNTTNPLISKVICFPERPTYKTLFEATTEYPNDINIICNSDIFFDQTLLKIKELFQEILSDPPEYDGRLHCLALTRWDQYMDGDQEGSIERYVDRGSQDTWVFLGAVQFVDQMFCDFHLGVAGCDNRIAYELREAGYTVLNPSEDIRTLHLHNSGVRNYNPGRKIPGPHLLLDATGIYNTKDTKYYVRTKEEVGIEITEDYKDGQTQRENNPDTSVSVIDVRGKIKILHLALMSGDNGFTSEFKKLGDYLEIDYQSIKRNQGKEALTQHMIDVGNHFIPDLIFLQLQEADIISPAFIELIGSSWKSKVIVWTGDIRHTTPDYLLALSDHCTLSFSNERDVTNVGDQDAKFLQIGIDPEIFRTLTKYEIDDQSIIKPKMIGEYESYPEIVFMGNHYGSGHFPLSDYRKQAIEELKNEFGSNFITYGNDSEKSLMDSQKAENIAYNFSKIGISISHFHEERYFSDRLLRIMGSGCMALSHHYPGIEKDFEVGVHLDTFKNIEELKYKTYHYLHNEPKRAKIAAAGQKHVHENFTFKNMVENIYKIYKGE